MYMGNTYLITSAIGFVIIVVIYQPLGELAYDYFRGHDKSHDRASVKPVEEQDEGEGGRTGFGEASRKLRSDAENDKVDVVKDSAKEDVHEDQKKTEEEESSAGKEGSPPLASGGEKHRMSVQRPSILVAGTAIEDLRKSLGDFKEARF